VCSDRAFSLWGVGGLESRTRDRSKDLLRQLMSWSGYSIASFAQAGPVEVNYDVWFIPLAQCALFKMARLSYLIQFSTICRS
jgi:hypothetical protein